MKIEEQSSNDKILNVFAFYFERNISKYVFPEFDPETVKLSINKLEILVAQYVEEIFPEEDHEEEKRKILKKIDDLGLKRLQHGDDNLRKLKDLRSNVDNSPFINLKEYEYSHVDRMVRQADYDGQVSEYLDILKKIKGSID